MNEIFKLQICYTEITDLLHFKFVVPCIVILGLKNSNKMQQYVDVYLLLNYCTCFGPPSRPSSGVHKTVVTASGTDHTVWGRKLPQTWRNKDWFGTVSVTVGHKLWFQPLVQITDGPKPVLIWSRLRKLSPQTVWCWSQISPHLVTSEEVNSPDSMMLVPNRSSFGHVWGS